MVVVITSTMMVHARNILPSVYVEIRVYAIAKTVTTFNSILNDIISFFNEYILLRVLQFHGQEKPTCLL